VRTIATIFALAAALWAVQAGAALLFHRRRVRGYLDEAHPGRDARLFHRLRTLPVRAACLYRRQPRVWMLTGKGASHAHPWSHC
jgi:hypothetical protein